MSNAITYRMPFGVQGDVSRAAIATIESQALGASAFGQYGVAGKIVTGKFVPVTTQNDIVYGFLVRPFPITGANASDPLGTSVPPATGVANILRRGYFVAQVQLGGATAALGSGVFLRYQNPSGTQIVGGVEGATSGNNYQLTTTYVLSGAGAYFASPTDANGLAEVAFNI
jgi:hypothetical protein